MITRGKVLRALLLVLLVVSILARNTSWDAGYFIADAFCWCVALGIIVLTTTGSVRIIAEGIFLLTISNFLDEVFFDPTVTQWNEWLFAGSVLALTAYKLIKNARRNNS